MKELLKRQRIIAVSTRYALLEMQLMKIKIQIIAIFHEKTTIEDYNKYVLMQKNNI